MTPTVLKRGARGGEKGCWWPLKDGDRITASLSCPGCGSTGTLSDHSISIEGLVQPSVACMNDCGFHEYVRLEGWPPVEVLS